jgi:hypothetical protein
MTILRSGSTEKYSENWANAFGEKKTKGAKATKSATPKTKTKVKGKSKAVKKAASKKS